MRIELSENALKILEARYLKKDEQGNLIESPEEMFRRVAHHVSSAEKVFNWNSRSNGCEELFFELMASLTFLPNSPTLMNAGRELGQLSACFVLPIEDRLDSIFETLKKTALIHKSGGGTGFSFSKLRPENDIVATTSGVASGPVSFMKIFNTATEIVKQGGTRRGANMGVLRVDHPDIERFVTVKRNPSELQSFNLSVGITDGFMNAVRTGRDFRLINPRTGRSVRKVMAGELFDLMVECAWESGEPGLLFLDRINRDNPLPRLGDIEATNPCGEQPLLPYESCNLGSINLTKMIRRTPGSVQIDWEKLKETVTLAVRFLDDVIEVNHFPFPEIERMTRANRKIGLGVMGFAHFLILLGIDYGSEESIRVAREVMSFISEHAHAASCELARQRGGFPNYPRSIHPRKGKPALRNAVVTTIAPTGTLSMIAGCSSGIEPLYALSTTKVVAGGIELSEIDPVFVLVAQGRGIMIPEPRTGSYPESVLKGEIPLPEDVRDLFVTALEIPPSKHVEMQAVFQQYTDNAVSKTINFPSSVTPGEMREALLLAHELGCKGITIYRDHSRAGQVIRCSTDKVC